MRPLILMLCVLSVSPAVFAGENGSEPDRFTDVTRSEIRHLEVLHFRAQELIAAGNLREAVALYWEIVLLEPDDDAAYTNLGHLYLILGDNGQAKDAFQNALHINPENEAAQAGFLKITHPDEFPG